MGSGKTTVLTPSFVALADGKTLVAAGPTLS